jgi:hypothetical protein
MFLSLSALVWACEVNATSEQTRRIRIFFMMVGFGWKGRSVPHDDTKINKKIGIWKKMTRRRSFFGSF